jgi:hypothetical protein
MRTVGTRALTRETNVHRRTDGRTPAERLSRYTRIILCMRINYLLDTSMLHLIFLLIFDRLLIYGRGGNFVTFLQYIDKVLTQREQTETGDIVFSFCFCSNTLLQCFIVSIIIRNDSQVLIPD